MIAPSTAPRAPRHPEVPVPQEPRSVDPGKAAPPETERGIVTRGLHKVYPVPRSAQAPATAAAGARAKAAGSAGAAATGHTAAAPNGITALESLDLAIRPGEMFGLLGPNGAGKTTTVGILTTRVRATAGEAWVAGADAVRDPVAVKQRIGVVPQRPNPDRALTVIENLLFHAAYFGVARGVALERARRLLDRLGIADRANARGAQLSGGQQQRLMIARALMHEPRVLFLDEPSVGLDPQARLLLWEILHDLHSQGHTIVMTTHYMEEADRLCQRVAIIDRGRLLALDTPAELKSHAPGGTLVELTFDGAAPDTPSADQLPGGVSKLEVAGPVVRAYAERPGEAIAALMRAADGRQVKNIHLAPPSLESLFVSLTGRSLQ